MPRDLQQDWHVVAYKHYIEAIQPQNVDIEKERKIIEDAQKMAQQQSPCRYLMEQQLQAILNLVR